MSDRTLTSVTTLFELLTELNTCGPIFRRVFLDVYIMPRKATDRSSAAQAAWREMARGLPTFRSLNSKNVSLQTAYAPYLDVSSRAPPCADCRAASSCALASERDDSRPGTSWV